jgi:hypothetical protein
MKYSGWLVLVLALSLVVLTACSQAEDANLAAFDALARHVPGDAEQPFFLNLKPGGEAGRHWERIRGQLEADPTGEEALRELLRQFRVEEYGLDEFASGPAVNGYGNGIEYAIVQVSDDAATRDALQQHYENVVWEQEEFAGKTLTYGRNLQPGRQGEHLAWTVHDGLLFLTSSFSRASEDRAALTKLQALLSLDREDSLAALDSWETLRDRLPEEPMGLVFFNAAEQARRRPPPPGDTSLNAALGQQLEGIALAAVPENDGMRVEIVGTLALEADAPRELRALFGSSAVDATTWTGLPANTAIALVARDASVVWPVLQEMFGIGPLDLLRDTIGLDLEADLAAADGPLTGEFALAITPPLPDQPISQDLPAGQLAILTQDASEAQVANVQAAMEGRGAIFGPGEVEGVALQTQAGTEPTGYAISYGFDGDTLLFGSSPGVIGHAVADRRENRGLVKDKTFQVLAETLPDDPSFVVYLNSEPLLSLMEANMTEQQYNNSQELFLFRVFEAIGVGLRLEPDRVDGVLYFFVAD